LGDISYNRHLLGASIIASENADIKINLSQLTCKDYFDFKAQLWLALQFRQGHKEYLREIVTKCPRGLYPILYENHLNKGDRKKTIGIKQMALFDMSNRLFQFLQGPLSCFDPSAFQFCREVKQFIMKDNSNYLLNHLAELVLAMKSGNTVMAKDSILKTINQDYNLYILSNPREWQSDFPEKRLALASRFFDFLTELKKFLKDDFIFKCYLTYWGNFLRGMDFDRVSGSLGGIFSIDEWNKLKIRIYRDQSLDLFSNFLLRGDHWSWYYSNFQQWLSDNRNKEILLSYGKQDLINDFFILFLMKKENLKKSIEKVNPELKKPLFQLEHDYYIRLLHSEQATNFAIFKLFQLGDENEEILKKVML
jgi:hypothetical protein